MADSKVPWGFVTLTDEAALIAWQAAHPELLLYLNHILRLDDASLFVVYGTIEEPVPGIYHVLDGQASEQLSAFCIANPTYVIFDLIRTCDGKCMIVYIIPT